MSLSLKEAQSVVEFACLHAEKIGVPMNIAVVDGGGHLLAFARMDKSILGSIDIALKKAKTSVLFNGPSEELWEYCKPGSPAPATEASNGGLIPYAGGVPIREADGSLAGAIGVSGGMPAQDGEVARAGLSGRERAVRTMFETNVFSNLALAQHVARKFLESKTRGRILFVSSMGGMLTAYGFGAYCASKHALEGVAAALRDELAPSGITVQTINPGAYDTGFNDRLADTTYHWHDDDVHLTKEHDIRANFAPLLKGQFDPQEMIDKMVEVIGAEEGLYRNVWPPAVETLIKQVQERAWTLRTNGK